MDEGIKGGLPFVCEKINRTLNGGDYISGTDIIGSIKNNKYIDSIIHENEILISKDYTSTSNIIGKNEQLFTEMNMSSKLNVFSSESIGMKDVDNVPIQLEQLFSREYIKFSNNLYGINIPHYELLKRNMYNWFCKLNKMEILECDNILCKYFLISNNTN